MRFLLPAAIVITAVYAAAQEQPAPAKRDIVFHRPETKGEKYTVTGNCSIRSETSTKFEDELQGDPGPVSMEMEIEGSLEITEVTPNAGGVKAFRFKVKEMSFDVDEEEPLEPGTVIEATVEKFRATFKVDGEAVSPAMGTCLGEALPRFSGMDEALDENFKPSGPVAPGEEWKPNLKGIAGVYERTSGMKIDTGKSSATVSYTGTKKIGALEGDTISLSKKLTILELPEVPKGTKLISSKSSHEFLFTLASDPKVSLPLSERSLTEMDSQFSFEIDGAKGEFTTRHTLQSSRTSVPVK